MRGRFIAPFFLVAALIGVSGCATAGEYASAAPAKVLFVGNSFTYYNNSLHNHYRALVNASGMTFAKPQRARSLTISGGRLPEHLGGFANMVRSDDWDVVVMQGHSLGPIGDETAAQFRAAASDYATIVRAQGARPVFFMTWAYSDEPEMTARLDAAYSAIGDELSATVVPVGRAFEYVTNERPTLDLRTEDKKHPSLAGTYLAACTFFAVLQGVTPEGLPYDAGLDAETAKYLQQAAWLSVAAYRSRTVD